MGAFIKEIFKLNILNHILMETNLINITVTGAAGQIGYSLVPMIASGQMFGNMKINLSVLGINY
jgi:hypothetical protein